MVATPLWNSFGLKPTQVTPAAQAHSSGISTYGSLTPSSCPKFKLTSSILHPTPFSQSSQCRSSCSMLFCAWTHHSLSLLNPQHPLLAKIYMHLSVWTLKILSLSRCCTALLSEPYKTSNSGTMVIHDREQTEEAWWMNSKAARTTSKPCFPTVNHLLEQCLPPTNY